MRPSNLLLIMALLLSIGQAQGHALNASAFMGDEGVAGEAFYSDQTPAAGVFVELLDAAGKLLAEGKTDEHGRFALTASGTAHAQGASVVVHGEEGHRTEVPVRERASSAFGQADIRVLREDIARLEQRLWWRDVLGAIGYLFGAFGLYALITSRRSAR